MTVLITLTIAGASTGNFDLYSNVDGYVSAFATGVAKIDLEAGYTSYTVPDGTTTIRVKSNATCKNYIDLVLGAPATTTTTTSSTSSTSTTSSTTTVAPECFEYYNNTQNIYIINYFPCNGGDEVTYYSVLPGQGVCVISISGDYGYLTPLGNCS